MAFLKPVLEELGFTPQQIHSLVTATGATHGRTYGYTYSDLAQRLLPGLLLAAYPSNPIPSISRRRSLSVILRLRLSRGRSGQKEKSS